MPREQGVLDDGLWGKFRVDAGGAEKQHSLDTLVQRRVQHVDLDAYVLAEEVDRIGAVSENAADLRGGQYDILRLDLAQVVEHCRAVLQIKLGRGLPQQPLKARELELAPDRRTHQAAVACDVESGIAIKGARPIGDLVTVFD